MVTARRAMLAVLLAFLAVLPVLPALAADAAVLNAVTFRPVPVEEAIYVRSLDDDESVARVRRSFERALVAGGYAVTDAPRRLVLTLEVSDQVGSWSYGSSTLFSTDRSYDERTRRELDSFQLNVYDSRQGGLVNQPERAAPVAPSRYRLDARLDDRETGRTLWQGWVVGALDRGDGDDLLAMMVPVLAGGIGRTVREATVELR